ncbi:hypothetical protein [Acidiferrobacter sp.]|jgi:hypothetical protein|uniref:hypothetical protein n=1 Tax=Acidiferrobacter sp. TaxID=1872107 RepID=UPI0026162432|nr:hypothetical protein [Acidiferrobacter sp.]
MADTTLSPAQSVDADHHDHHHRHSGDVRDGGDDASLLLQSPAEGMPDDPITLIEAAIERLRDDVGAIVEPAVVAAFSILRTTDLLNYLRLRHKAKEANKGCLVTELDKAVQQSLPAGSDEPSALDELVALARNQCQLKHDAARNAVAVIPMTGRQEVWRVYSTGYEEWLRTAYWRAKEAGVPETTMKSALATIAAAGINDGEQIDLHVRAAKDEAGYLIDLCDEQWRVVLVTPTGWQVLDHSPVHFTRTQSMRPLPEPQAAATSACSGSTPTSRPTAA